MYSVKETAAMLGVHRSSVERLIRMGALRAIKFPRMGGRGRNFMRRIPESAIAEFKGRYCNAA
jgi:excisionase family DNA binding protein